MKTFEDACTKMLKEYSIQEDEEFSYYSGPENDVLLLDTLDISTLTRKVEEGEKFKTVHIARREDAVNYGYPDVSGHKFYVFYQKQDFTKPALIPF